MFPLIDQVLPTDIHELVHKLYLYSMGWVHFLSGPGRSSRFLRFFTGIICLFGSGSQQSVSSLQALFVCLFGSGSQQSVSSSLQALFVCLFVFRSMIKKITVSVYE